jgi:signal transduction histidine kinase
VTVPRCSPDPGSLERPAPGEGTSLGVAEPLAGVESPFITIATRRVARQLRVDSANRVDAEVTAALLAAIALAVEHRHPDYVATLLPHPSPAVGQRLAELLRGWTDRSSSVAPSVMLDALTALEQVRHALNHGSDRPADPGVTGADALDLFAEIGHDLRSPLTSILCLADTLQRGQSGDINPLQRRQVGLIYSAALGLCGLVTDAIDLTCGGEVGLAQEVGPLSLYELLDGVGNIVRPMAEEKGLRLGLAPVEPDHRLGNGVALSRALLNLTTNALKFTERGGVEIACAAPAPTRVEFSVTDTGPGVNPDAITSLYQPFRRAQGRSGYRFSGTGLGLAVTRRLVAALGGDLKLDTGAWGTRFSFELELPPLLPG